MAQFVQASFKGVPFEVESTSDEFGRRGPVYEYPLSEEGGYKDLGRKLRRYKVSGYVIGGDHALWTLAVVAAAESPEPGLLLHPVLEPRRNRRTMTRSAYRRLWRDRSVPRVMKGPMTRCRCWNAERTRRAPTSTLPLPPNRSTMARRLHADGMPRLRQGRVKTGTGIENSDVDIIQPVGFASPVPAGLRVQALTMDIGADPSRRIAFIIGDRNDHPRVEEGEIVFYAPGDPKKAVRIKKDGGISVDGDDQPIDIRTQKLLTMTAELGAGLFDVIEVSPDGDVTFRGNVQIDGNLNVSGSIRSPDIKET